MFGKTSHARPYRKDEEFPIWVSLMPEVWYSICRLYIEFWPQKSLCAFSYLYTCTPHFDAFKFKNLFPQGQLCTLLYGTNTRIWKSRWFFSFWGWSATMIRLSHCNIHTFSWVYGSIRCRTRCWCTWSIGLGSCQMTARCSKFHTGLGSTDSHFSLP